MILKVAKTTNINGTIRISGSKNSSLALICASLLSKEEVVLNNGSFPAEYVQFLMGAC